MHVGITSVYWGRWKSVRCKIISIQVASNLVRKHCKLLIFTQWTLVTMENNLPVTRSKALWLIIFDREQILWLKNRRSLALVHILMRKAARTSKSKLPWTSLGL